MAVGLRRSGDRSPGRRWIGWTAAALLTASSGVVLARSASAPFSVTVTLFPPYKETVDCGTSGQGPSISVSCSNPNGRGDNPRFLLQLYRDGAQVGTVDGSTTPGTVTSWKVVRVADRDFLEIVVGW